MFKKIKKFFTDRKAKKELERNINKRIEIEILAKEARTIIKEARAEHAKAVAIIKKGSAENLREIELKRKVSFEKRNKHKRPLKNEKPRVATTNASIERLQTLEVARHSLG